MSKKSKKKLSRKKMLTIAIVAGILALAILVGVLVRFIQQKTTDSNTGQDTFVPGQNLPKAATDSQALAGQGKFDEANKKVDEALAGNPQDAEKYELYIQQGINYQNQKDYPKALESYKKAEAVKQDYKVTVLIGDVAMAQGNKPLALEYYKKALGLLATDNPLYNSEKRRLEDKIKAAGG